MSERSAYFWVYSNTPFKLQVLNTFSASFATFSFTSLFYYVRKCSEAIIERALCAAKHLARQCRCESFLIILFNDDL